MLITAVTHELITYTRRVAPTNLTEAFDYQKKLAPENLFPGASDEEHWDLVKRIVTALVRDKKIIEFRAQRNMLGEPQVKITICWELMTHWAAFTQSDEWMELDAELRTLVSHLQLEIWAPSEYMPDPIRP